MGQKIIDIISQVIGSNNDIVITLDAPLSDLLVDSIKFIKMVVALESEFDFEFDDEMLLITKFPIISTIIEYVKSKV